MDIPEKLLEVLEYKEEGYSPVVDYCSWRVAVLNYSDRLLPQNLSAMQRHNETDEVFILLRGRCILFVGEGDQDISDIWGVDMQPLKIYNVRKSTWHTHTLDRDAMVLIVENRDTTYDNSPFCPLTSPQQQIIMQQTADLWNEGKGDIPGAGS